jgi:predicted amidohydrolase YtcJ
MNRLLHALCFFALIGLLSALWGHPGTTNRLVFTHVTVIDGTGPPAQPNMAVLIEGDRITSLEQESTATPTGAEVVDAKGGFLIPGLWDMHVQLSWTKACALPALVANGVTGVRDMGGLLRE